MNTTKKYIAGSILALTLAITPLTTFAQTAPADPQTAYVQALQQVLDLLIKQVAELMKQLAEVKAQQGSVETKVDTIVRNTTPAPSPTPQVFGAVSVPEVDKSDIVVEYSKETGSDVANHAPFGIWAIKVKVLDKEGKTVKLVDVTINAQDDWYPSYTRPTDNTYPDYSEFRGQWFHVFGFQPQSTGVKTITFTSGNLTKTITIEVK